MAERYRLRREAVEWREVEGEVIAIDLNDSRYLAINRTGALLWEQLGPGATAEELTACLSATFAIDREAAEGDVARFLAELQRRGLVTTGQ